MLGLLYKEGKKPLVRQKCCLCFPPGVSSMEILPSCFLNLPFFSSWKRCSLLFFFLGTSFLLSTAALCFQVGIPLIRCVLAPGS